MKTPCCWRACLLLGLHLVAVSAQVREQFDEDLILRPLRDGKLSTTFRFTTLLRGSSPRDPQTLNSDDEGAFTCCVCRTPSAAVE